MPPIIVFIAKKLQHKTIVTSTIQLKTHSDSVSQTRQLGEIRRNQIPTAAGHLPREVT